MIEPGAEFKVTGTHKEEKYKLEIKSVINNKIAPGMKGSQMNIVIITKSSQVNVLKATNNYYTIEDKIINFTINDFNKEEKMLIGMVFGTSDKEFVEVVKITYRYMVKLDF
jgi:transcriptional regulator